MGPEAWRRRLGNNLYTYIVGDNADPTATAALLTRLYESGWRGPEVAPEIDPSGTRVLWPTETGTTAALTSDGLEHYYTSRGHRFYLLRMSQLVRAMGGPLAARMQEMFAAYEEQCAADGVATIPEWADWNVFVGGEKLAVDGTGLLGGFSTGE